MRQLQGMIASDEFAELLAYDRLTGELRLSDTVTTEKIDWAAEAQRQAKERSPRGATR